MPVRVEWCEEFSEIICVEVITPWGWDEFRDGLHCATNLIEAAETVRAFLVDVRPAGDFPPNGFIRNSRYALNYLPLVPMIFLSDTQMMPMVMTPVINIMRTKRKYHFVHKEDDVARIVEGL